MIDYFLGCMIEEDKQYFSIETNQTIIQGFVLLWVVKNSNVEPVHVSLIAMLRWVILIGEIIICLA